MDHMFEAHLLQTLLEMGYSNEQATLALSSTHYVGVEAAVHWILEHPSTDEASTSRAPQIHRRPSGPAIGQPVMGIPSVAPIVIHPDGQPAHAVEVGGGSDIKVVVIMAGDAPKAPSDVMATSCTRAAVALCSRAILAGQDVVPWMAAWMLCGQKVELVAVDDATELQQLAHEAQQLPVMCYMHQDGDCGGEPTPDGLTTMLAMAGPTSLLERLTANLKSI